MIAGDCMKAGMFLFNENAELLPESMLSDAVIYRIMRNSISGMA